jgi:uncharacterized integral membrane protein
MERLPVVPPEQSPEKKSRRGQRRDVARLVGLVAVAGAVAAFVVQNSQNVSVHFWFFSRHEPLIFVVLGCLVVGVLVGYVMGRRRGARKVRRALLHKPDSL